MAKNYIKFELNDEILYFSTTQSDKLELGSSGCIEIQPDMSKIGISWAYLNPDGNIMQYGQVIGNVRDIEVLDNE